jgi:phosphatidylglycerophosphate synthase
MTDGAAFDAVVLATGEVHEVCGLTLAERGRRVALKAGAARVLVIDVQRDDAIAPSELAAWLAEAPARPLAVLDVTAQIIHVPLLAALDVRAGAPRIVHGPDGAFAGAVLADPARRDELAAALTPGALAELATRWQGEGVEVGVHGDLARHPARDAAERRAATKYLFRLVDKAQDTWLVRKINRKVAYPFTRLLLPTSLSPNMITVIVFLIGLAGCLLLLRPGYWGLVEGTLVLLFAGYLDSCDGEIARLRLESSKLGAWLDTIADEITSVVSIACVGIHFYNEYPYDWVLWFAVLAVVGALVTIYCVYYFLIVSGGSGNSQDYPTNPGLLDYLRLMIRREVINLGSTLLALAGLGVVMFAGLGLGAIISAAVLVPQHISLRRALPSGNVRAALRP